MRKNLFLLILSLMGVFILAQAGPFTPNAKVLLQFDPSQPLLGTDSLQVDIYVDLTGVSGSGSATAVLGGYAIPVAFDNLRLHLTSVDPGTDTHFSDSTFVYTDINRANARGFVTVINTQTDSSAPTGLVHVAQLHFNLTEAGNVNFNVNSARTLHEGSLSSAYDASKGGPDEITYDDHLYTVSLDSGGALYHLIYPVFVSTDNDFQGITVVNGGDTASDLTFTAYNPNGTLIQLSGMTNPNTTENSISSLHQYVRMSQNLFGSSTALGISSGWIDITSSQHNISGFFLLGHFDNGILTELDGADVSHVTANHLILPVFGKDSSRNTVFYIVNPGSSAANGTIKLYDEDGNVVNTSDFTITAKGYSTNSYGSDLITGHGYFDIEANSGKITCFEEFGNDKSLAVLNGQDVDMAANVLYAAHFASGFIGIRYFTRLSVINPGNTDANVTFHLLDDMGSEIVPAVTKTIKAHNQLCQQGYELFGLSDPASATSLTQGTVMIESDQGIVGSVTFGDADTGKFLASLPLLSTSSARREIFLDHVAIGQIGNVDYFTGIALVNPSQTRDAHIQIQVYDQDGNIVAQTSTPYVLKAGHRISQMLGNFFGGSFPGSQFGGFIKLSSDVEIYSFMLFGDTSLNFLSAVPVR